MTLHERLREARERKRLTQAEIAEVIGVSQNAVSKWEAGSCAPCRKRIGEVARAYGIRLRLEDLVA
jgi:transcriptional regulator with XRE-family HTH domain